MAETRRAHIAQYKKEAVDKLAKQLVESPIIAVANMQDLPAAQLAAIKKSLRGKVLMVMAKRRLMNIAIDQVQEKISGADKLKAALKGMPALLLTSENPFSIYRTIKKNMSPAPAKAGQLAPFDIIVPAGPTPFTPGPVISELAQLGIKAGVEGGKIAIKADATVCKEGHPISAPLASMLLRLGITPMRIGLNVTAVLEKGVVYKKDVLDIDEDAFLSQLTTAAQEAVNLAVDAGILTKETTDILIQRAAREAHQIVLESSFPAIGAMEDLLVMAERTATSFAAEANVGTQ